MVTYWLNNDIQWPVQQKWLEYIKWNLKDFIYDVNSDKTLLEQESDMTDKIIHDMSSNEQSDIPVWWVSDNEDLFPFKIATLDELFSEQEQKSNIRDVPPIPVSWANYTSPQDYVTEDDVNSAFYDDLFWPATWKSRTSWEQESYVSKRNRRLAQEAEVAKQEIEDMLQEVKDLWEDITPEQEHQYNLAINERESIIQKWINKKTDTWYIIGNRFSTWSEADKKYKEANKEIDKWSDIEWWLRRWKKFATNKETARVNPKSDNDKLWVKSYRQLEEWLSDVFDVNKAIDEWDLMNTYNAVMYGYFWEDEDWNPILWDGVSVSQANKWLAEVKDNIEELVRTWKMSPEDWYSIYNSKKKEIEWLAFESFKKVASDYVKEWFTFDDMNEFVKITQWLSDTVEWKVKPYINDIKNLKEDVYTKESLWAMKMLEWVHNLRREIQGKATTSLSDLVVVKEALQGLESPSEQAKMINYISSSAKIMKNDEISTVARLEELWDKLENISWDKHNEAQAILDVAKDGMDKYNEFMYWPNWYMDHFLWWVIKFEWSESVRKFKADEWAKINLLLDAGKISKEEFDKYEWLIDGSIQWEWSRFVLPMRLVREFNELSLEWMPREYTWVDKDGKEQKWFIAWYIDDSVPSFWGTKLKEEYTVWNNNIKDYVHQVDLEIDKLVDRNAFTWLVSWFTRTFDRVFSSLWDGSTSAIQKILAPRRSTYLESVRLNNYDNIFFSWDPSYWKKVRESIADFTENYWADIALAAYSLPKIFTSPSTYELLVWLAEAEWVATLWVATEAAVETSRFASTLRAITTSTPYKRVSKMWSWLETSITALRKREQVVKFADFLWETFIDLTLNDGLINGVIDSYTNETMTTKDYVFDGMIWLAWNLIGSAFRIWSDVIKNKSLFDSYIYHWPDWAKLFTTQEEALKNWLLKKWFIKWEKTVSLAGMNAMMEAVWETNVSKFLSTYVWWKVWRKTATQLSTVMWNFFVAIKSLPNWKFKDTVLQNIMLSAKNSEWIKVVREALWLKRWQDTASFIKNVTDALNSGKDLTPAQIEYLWALSKSTKQARADGRWLQSAIDSTVFGNYNNNDKMFWVNISKTRWLNVSWTTKPSISPVISNRSFSKKEVEDIVSDWEAAWLSLNGLFTQDGDWWYKYAIEWYSDIYNKDVDLDTIRWLWWLYQKQTELGKKVMDNIISDASFALCDV